MGLSLICYPQNGKINPTQQTQLKKMSDECLRVKLVAYGYEEKADFTSEREELLVRYAEVIAAGAKPKIGPVSVDPEAKEMGIDFERRKLDMEREQADKQLALEKQTFEIEAQKAESERLSDLLENRWPIVDVKFC